MNIDAPILAAQAATSVRDTTAATATMGFVRSLSTANSIVDGGVVFQNRMSTKNEKLAQHLGGNSSLASNFTGHLAASSVGDISSLGLPAGQESAVRETYFEALRMIWILYVAFAGLATVLNLLVRPHKLGTENEGAVLGADRGQQDDRITRQSNVNDGVELQGSPRQ
ncbi:hypothetical protein BDV19DRAFT_383883 [Aspergillus venezuelensis]